MNVRYYGYFDITSKAYVRIFPSVNDLTAKRDSEQFANTLKEKDPLLAKDIETHYLFTIDNETGKIVENQVKEVFIFKDYFVQCDQLEKMEAANNGKN